MEPKLFGFRNSQINQWLFQNNFINFKSYYFNLFCKPLVIRVGCSSGNGEGLGP